MPFEPLNEAVEAEAPRGRFVPLEEETVLREDTGDIITAPSGLSAPEVTYLDDVGNRGERKESFFGFNKVLNRTKDVVTIPFKGAAATAVNLASTGVAGSRLKIADAIKQGLTEDVEAIQRKALNGEDITDEERRVMMRDISQRNMLFGFLFQSPEDIVRNKAKKAVRKGDTEEIAELTATADRLTESVGKIRASADRIVAERFPRPEKEDSTLAERILYDASGATVTIGTSIGLAVVTKNPVASAALFSELQNSDIYLEARDSGAGVEKSKAKANLAGAVEGGLEFVGVNYFFKIAENSKGLSKHLRRMGEEALQEFMQQGGEEIITQSGGIREVDILGGLERAGYSAFLGSIGGGVTSVSLDVIAKKVSKEEGIPEQLVKNYLEKAQAQNETLVDAVAQDIEGEASDIKNSSQQSEIDQAVGFMQDFAEGRPIDISKLKKQDRILLEQEIEQRKLERDDVSVAGENQIIAIENEQQAQFIKQAESLKEQVDSIPDFTRNDIKSVAKAIGYRPKSLTDFIKETGGVRDAEGELKARDVTNKSKVGLITKKNRNVATENGVITQDAQVDAVIQRAFDAGYFPDKNSVDEISHSDLYDAISEDLSGDKIFNFEDSQKIDALFEGIPADAEQAFFERGIERDMSVEDIATALRAEQGLDPFIERQPIVSELVNNERLKNRVEEIIKVKEDQYGLISGNLLSRNLEKLTQSDFAQDFALGIGKATVPISTRIKNISPKLFVRLRQYEFDVKEAIMSDVESVSPFLRAFKKLDKDTQLAMDLALKNGDVELIDYIAKRNNMVDEVKATQEVLENIYSRSQDAGVDVEYRKNYFPRRVKDVDGLIDHFKKGKYWNTIEKAFKNWADSNVPLTEENKKKLRDYRSKITKEIKGGETRRLTKAESKQVSELYAEKKKSMPRRALTNDEKAKIINSLVRGFSVGGITISRSGNLKKKRAIENVTADINKFYENPEQALLAYVNGVNETIETSRLFGKGRVIEGEGQLNVEDSVGAFIEEAVAAEQINNRETEILKDAFNARFNTGRMGWITGSLRDLIYIDVMGSPLNALTQFGDLATSMYNAGILNTATTIGGATVDRTKVDLRDLTIEDVAQEFDNNNMTSKWVSNVFKLTGLQKIDRIGKLTLVNSTLKKFQKQAKKGNKELLNTLDLYFEQDAKIVLQDLKEGNVTDDVKFLAFNTLLDFQPVARSEMPQYYLTNGNLKILYILKSFTIKQLDVYRREVFTNLNKAAKSGDPKLAAKALSNFVRLAGFWIAMGASADYMKDMLRSAFGGDEMEEPEDYVIDNIFKAFGWSRYQTDMISRQGASDVAFDVVKPPTKFFDNIQKDYKTFKKEGLTLENSKSIRSIPVGGELYYFWFGAKSGENNGKDKLFNPN